MRKSSSTLEKMPLELQVRIMEMVHISGGRASLQAMIHASPVFFQSFLSQRVAILSAPVIHNLGPYVQDAVALLQAKQFAANAPYHDLNERTFMTTFREDTAKLKQLNDKYRTNLNSALAAPEKSHILQRGITAEMAVPILRLNEAVQHIVDVYEASRLPPIQKLVFQHVPASWWPQMWERPNPSPHTGPEILKSCIESFSLTERCRLARALLRRDRQMDLHVNRLNLYFEFAAGVDPASTETLTSSSSTWESLNPFTARMSLQRNLKKLPRCTHLWRL